MLSTRTSGRTHSGHQLRAGTCPGSECAKLVVVVAGAAAAAEPIATALASEGRRRCTEALIGDPDMGITGVEDGQGGAGPDVMGSGVFWMLEREATCSAPPRSTAGLEVAGYNVKGWVE